VSPKTLTGAELQLDDGPARDSELFLVDGNNLAYRAYFALPEELATSEGFPTNALLGFTNMLFKLLADYRPKGVAVAWDTRATHRKELDPEYKVDRRPMPDLLSEQFPHFRPIVEAFGYRNLEFEGWEADDVIATLAARADEGGIKTTVVSTDRDAFQLVSDNVALMMTPRGVADVHVYTPDRVFARYGVTPEQVPDFIGLKGDTSDNIPGVPGIGDKTAGQLVAQYGSLEGVLEHVDDLSPARGRALREHADQARASKVLATMRRDLPLDCDPAELVLSPPDRSRLKEMFRQYEFRNLLQRVDVIDEAIPAAPMKLEGVAVPWREGSCLAAARGGRDRGRGWTRRACTGGGRRCRLDAGSRGRAPRGRSRRPRREAPAPRCRGRHAPHGVPDRAGPRDLCARRSRRRVRGRAAARATRGGRHRCSRSPRVSFSEARRSDAAADHRTRPRSALPRDRAPAHRGSLRDGGRGRQDRHVPHGRDHRTARRSPRGARNRAHELAGEEFMLGSTQQVARVLFEVLGLTAGRKGKTGYSTDSRVLRSIRGEHEIVAVIEEWREYSKLLNTYLGPLPELISPDDGRLHTTFNQAVASTGRLSTTSPNLQAIPIRTELGREIRSAFVAEAGHRLVSADYSQVELRILAHVSGEPKLREAFAQGEDIHAATAAEVLGKERAELTKDERNVAKMVNFGIIYGISAFGLSENLEIPREQAQEYIDTYLARFPLVQDFIQRTIEHCTREGYATSLFGRRRPVPELKASNRQTRSLGERLAVNFVMQGTAADIIKKAMVAIHARLRDEGRASRLVLQVHDELLVEAPDVEISAIKDTLREEMCGAYPLDPPLAVDVGVGDDWNEAKS
jgi:DNA polymerase-1